MRDAFQPSMSAIKLIMGLQPADYWDGKPED
jgi:hypothetical protein